MTTSDDIFEMFAVPCGPASLGEAVTETEHALQTAHLAHVAGADDELVVAALLHDVGHLLPACPRTRDVASRSPRGCRRGLARAAFRPGGQRPVRLHVAAKRTVCRRRSHGASLSPASRLSLQLQGGPMTPEEARHSQDSARAAAVDCGAGTTPPRCPAWSCRVSRRYREAWRRHAQGPTS